MVKYWFIILLALCILISSCFTCRNLVDNNIKKCDLCHHIGLVLNDKRVQSYLHLENQNAKCILMKTNEILSEECILEVGKVQLEIRDSFSKEERYLEIIKYEIRDNKSYIEMECEFEGLLLFATFSRSKVCHIESLSLIEQ